MMSRMQLRTVYRQWFGQPSLVLELRRKRSPLTELDVLFYRSCVRHGDQDSRPTTFIATAGMSSYATVEPQRQSELFIRLDGEADKSRLELLGRYLATLATVPTDEGVVFIRNMVLCDVRLPLFDSMSCALLTSLSMFYSRSASGNEDTVRILNVVPLFEQEAYLAHQIGEAETYRQFCEAGVNWNDPNRAIVSLRLLNHIQTTEGGNES